MLNIPFFSFIIINNIFIFDDCYNKAGWVILNKSINEERVTFSQDKMLRATAAACS